MIDNMLGQAKNLLAPVAKRLRKDDYARANWLSTLQFGQVFILGSERARDFKSVPLQFPKSMVLFYRSQIILVKKQQTWPWNKVRIVSCGMDSGGDEGPDEDWRVDNKWHANFCEFELTLPEDWSGNPTHFPKDLRMFGSSGGEYIGPPESEALVREKLSPEQAESFLLSQKVMLTFGVDLVVEALRKLVDRKSMIVERIVKEPKMLQKKRRQLASKRARNGYIPDFDDRSTHILIQPQDLVKYTNHKGKHRSPVPHFRRGHWRRLTSERYTEKRGQLIWIKAMHVGEKSYTVGRHVYIPKLDM